MDLHEYGSIQSQNIYKKMWLFFMSNLKPGILHFRRAVTTLNKEIRYTGQILSHLDKAGWISIRNDKLDQRKKIYQIKKFDDVISAFKK